MDLEAAIADMRKIRAHLIMSHPFRPIRTWKGVYRHLTEEVLTSSQMRIVYYRHLYLEV
jgi:hypothetical protein